MLGRCSAPSTWIRVVEPVPAWVSWTNPLLSQLTPALLLYLSATGTIHLLLQHITSPTTATYPGRICPYGRQGQPSLCPPHQSEYPITLGVAAGTISGINILALEGGRRAFPATSTFYRERSQRAQPQAMAEQDNQDFHDDDPAPTGSWGTQRTQRGRGARARRRPSQTEILAGNVRDLTELVRVLVDTRRDANVVQFPEEPPEVTESTPSRPPRSGSRPRNPSPTGGRGSDRTRRESPRRQPQERADSSRVRSSSRHSQATCSAACRDRRPGVHRRIGRERSVDNPAKDEDYNQNRLDQLQRQLDQLVGQQFKMPSVNPYDGSTDADEHIENYQAHMLIQNANEAALCKSFCLSQWYRRLAPGSIGCFKQLADAFAAAFLSSKTRKLGASHLFGIKQGETEALKKYLERFDRAVVQVESCTDETLMQAFREGIKDARLVWTLAYDRPPTFAQLRGIAWRHAEADEYVRGRGLASREHSRLPGRKSEKNQTDQGRQDKGKAVVVERSGSNPSPRTPAGRFQQYTPLVTTIEHVLNQVTGRGLLRDLPPLWADRARRNQNKYCNFHKDVGHNTNDCIQLRDQIELLIRDGHLREFVERIITPTGPSRPSQAARRNPRPSDQADE
ncbi:hypothetical protein TIFTF001_043186 [Ficus carica]|uniref:Retrotransposon gag domain-containing protein n=1 Tax=Ficus carica TaxID=3494 RepID=A0AA88CLE9_FICCA|nr:hypothetical protein TIFTF001_043186 [Ficus carica]